MRDTDLSYIAAIIDGEGTISFRNIRHGRSIIPYVAVSNTDVSMLMWVRGKLVESGVKVAMYEMPKAKSSHKQAYILHMHGLDNVLLVLSLVTPYLKSKLEAATVMKRFINLRKVRGIRVPYTNKELELANRLRRTPIAAVVREDKVIRASVVSWV